MVFNIKIKNKWTNKFVSPFYIYDYIIYYSGLANVITAAVKV